MIAKWAKIKFSIKPEPFFLWLHFHHSTSVTVSKLSHIPFHSTLAPPFCFWVRLGLSVTTILIFSNFLKFCFILAALALYSREFWNSYNFKFFRIYSIFSHMPKASRPSTITKRLPKTKVVFTNSHPVVTDDKVNNIAPKKKTKPTPKSIPLKIIRTKPISGYKIVPLKQTSLNLVPRKRTVSAAKVI